MNGRFFQANLPKGCGSVTHAGNLEIDEQPFESGKRFFRRVEADIVHLEGQQKWIDQNLAHVELTLKLLFDEFGRIPADNPRGKEKPDKAVKA